MAALPGTHLAAVPRTRDADAARLRRICRRNLVWLGAAHLAGQADIVALLIIMPPPGGEMPDIALSTWVACGFYVLAAWATAVAIGSRYDHTALAWYGEGRRPTERELRSTLAMPVVCTVTDGVLWLGGVLLTFLLLLRDAPEVAVHVSTTLALGGLSTCAVAYLVAERAIRPVTTEALRFSPPREPVGLGVKGRLVLTWVVATGVPLLGIVLVGLHGLEDGVSPKRTAVAVAVIAALAVVLGLVMTTLTAQSVASPLARLRRALASVEDGELATALTVEDASELGLVQSGFNRMAAGLRERERLRDLFGRHVGEDVARFALDGEPRLGGEVREVAALFVDLCGSTELAARRPPDEVVALLNTFFGVVVDVVQTRGGWVNKFEGDAALCVFGAPVDRPLADSASCALAAARDLRARLAELDHIDAGIGVSAGPAVAGWLGAVQRLEYTVIGDPVNEAARLCERAKRDPARVLCSGAVLAAADPAERDRWRAGGSVVLRGRSSATAISAPAA